MGRMTFTKEQIEDTAQVRRERSQQRPVPTLANQPKHQKM